MFYTNLILFTKEVQRCLQIVINCKWLTILWSTYYVHVLRKLLYRESSLFSRGNEKMSCNRSQLPFFFSAAAEIPSLNSPVNSSNISATLCCYPVRILFFPCNHFSHEMSKQQTSTQQVTECQIIGQSQMGFLIFFFVLAPVCGEKTVLETWPRNGRGENRHRQSCQFSFS